jgi:integrase
VSRRAEHFLSVDESKKLLSSLEGHRLLALHVVLLSLGLRKGEALALRWTDINFDAATVTICRSLKRARNQPSPGGTYPDGKKTCLVFGSPKTNKSWRTLALPAPVVACLQQHRRKQAVERLAAGSWADETLVFTTPTGAPIDPANFGKQLAAIARIAGLGHRNPHQLRHSAATIMLAQGIALHEVKDVLGHDSISVTKDIYGHHDVDRGRADADAMGAALWGTESAS